VLSWQSVDMDQDGVLDVVAVISNRADQNYELTVLIQDAGGFSPTRIATMPIRTGALIEFEIQDIDRDGDPDIGLLTQQNELFWVMNEDGNFVPTTNQVSSDEFAIADDDGSSWLLTSSDSNVYRQSDGDFELVQEMSLFSTDVRWFDVDGDGDQDLVEVSEYAVSWFEQTDDGLFPFRRMIGTSYFRSQDVRVLDWDGDGDLDVLRRDVLGWTLMEQRFAGDSNNDGIFNSGDLVQVFQSGLYEAGASASFEQGDWNGDGVFDSADLVYVFQRDAYTYDAKWADAKWASDLASMIDANWRFAKQTTGRRR
ncbi:MAG: VCBS repeat-containing protein, partial [Planctomycetales bacterium]|nr:VCBS repeat-containing protein [Planctomycetales bacterium]